MPKTRIYGWLPVCWLAVACAPANKIAEELDTEPPSQGGSDTGRNTDDEACRAGGGDRSCAWVTACEAGCGTDTICLGDCRSYLCTAHEAMYCEMVNCINNACASRCEDLGDSDCLLCITTYCAASWARCTAATSCADDTEQ